MGAPAASAVPGLIECLGSGPPAKPGVAAKPGPPTAEEACRLYAAQSLGRIGPPAAAALPALRLTLRDPSEALRQAAEQAVRMIETPAG